MTAPADLSEYINRATGGNSGNPQYITKFMPGRIAGAAAPATIAGRPASLLTYDSTIGAGVAPGAVAAPGRTLNGALGQIDATGGRDLWCSFAGGGANVTGRLVLYDRLLHISGLSGTVTTAQTVGGTLTRNTGGTGNQIWAEIYSQVGTTVTTITASYTDQGAASGNTTIATTFGGTGFREQTRIIPLPLNASDSGVQAVASCTVLATTGTAGNFGITVARPLMSIPFEAIGSGGSVSALASGIGPVKIDADACLCLAFFPNTTTVPEIWTDFFFWER